MDEEHLEKIKKILNEWNPLGEKANLISDLDEYSTEATDILFHINTEINFKKLRSLKKEFGI